MTETGFLENLASSLETLTRLRMHGLQLSIDDFGTGYSSIQQLSRVPFTELKIDRSFVAGIHANSRNRSLVASMVNMAKELGLETVAEGAELESEVSTLRGLCCDQVQGYFFGRPMAGDDFLTWLEGDRVSA